MSLEADKIAAEENLKCSAHNASLEWVHLRCDHRWMMLPLQFVLAMEALDKDVERLATIRRKLDENEKSS